MMAHLDIHHSKRRIEYARAGLHRMFSADNVQVACEFLDRCQIPGALQIIGSAIVVVGAGLAIYGGTTKYWS